MTNEQLSASLSYLGDELLAECGARRQRPKRSWRTALIKAACIALVLFSGIYVAGRFDYSLGAAAPPAPARSRTAAIITTSATAASGATIPPWARASGCSAPSGTMATQ